ncbi:phytyl ester synthase 1, chloroplastic-like [Rutidosis leptorrhynchoides]|uniref:phytyl ester synthase 1, chloroplastic-like n=1 Tax=Rutidosis leptorrhynchoides TaxID=125765 RepID=UPI003A99F5D9
MALIPSNSSVALSPIISLKENVRLRTCVVCQNWGVLSHDSVKMSGVSHANRKGTNVATSRQDEHEELKPFWDDGYGTRTMRDCTEIAMDLIKSDGGPPRWFCPVACGKSVKDSPLLLYLPGIDGTGAGLAVHEKAFGKVFQVQCLHIPVWDRTPLEGLLRIIEETVMSEHNLSPNKPIYLLGECFGGTLALAVAARNPTIDLILVLANPATSYDRSMMHHLSSLMAVLPEEHYGMFPYAFSPLFGDYIKMLMVKTYDVNDFQSVLQLPANLCKDLPLLSVVARILPKDTLTWRLKLLKSAADYANSRLHATVAQVLVLASGNDKLMPSKDEAHRLSRLIKHCNVRVFEDNGHTILLERGANVLATIRSNHMYRRFSKFDIFNDFLPPSDEEFKTSLVEKWWYRLYIDAVAFSTMEDGKVVSGLAGIPDEGPVLIVGNHMLLAFDVFPLVAEFVREKKIMLHGLTHPEIFHINPLLNFFIIPLTDFIKNSGAIPVSGRNFYTSLQRKKHILLYPGGIREAMHRKGEAGKLFWPEKQEFVRMAVRFGATIVPYGGVGEDDILDLHTDYDDFKRNLIYNWLVNEYNKGRTNLREGMEGELADQQFHIPLFKFKIPGRLYFKFGKPIRTKGMEHMSTNEDFCQKLYSQIKCDVEKNVAYLLEKREEDPCRGVVERILWQLVYGFEDQVPSFEP